MSRFLFYSDLQLSGKRPRHRVDDYPAALLKKLAEAYQIALDEGCDFVVCGGDFFNRYRMFSYDLINDMVDIVGGSPLKTYMAIGQHDIHGYNPSSYRSSTHSFVTRYCPQMEVLWEPVDLGDLTLEAAHVWADWPEVLKRTPSRKKKSVLVAHLPLYRGHVPFDVIDVDQAYGCPFDLVVSGDIHAGYDTVEVDGTTFCNPGAMARQTVREVDRIVQVAVIDCVPRKPIEVRIIPLQSAQGGEAVFSEDALEQSEDAIELDVSDFVEDMLELEAESVDVFELIQKVAAKVGLDSEVLEYILSKRPKGE